MRQFEAELKDRESVPDEELVSRYFDERATAANVPGEVRRVFAKHMGYPADKLFPDDDLTFFWAELDMVDLINELESVFEIRFCREELARTPCTIRAVAILVR